MDISIFKNSINDYSALYPIDDLNLWGIKLFINNCSTMNMDTFGNPILNHNTPLATVDPNIWLPEFLDKLILKFKYVSYGPKSTIFQMDGLNKICSVDIDFIDRKEFSNIDDMVGYFSIYNDESTLVIYSVICLVDLIQLTKKYVVRYKDITSLKTRRDQKLKNLTE